MSTDNWILPAGAPRCVFADTLYRTAKDTIFSKLRLDTTPGQFAALKKACVYCEKSWSGTCRPCTTARLLAGTGA
jgi:hypothetical protein